jgi:CHC2 zinc finger/DNA polymerase family A
MRTLFLDIETRSAANLRECGSYVYSIDPSTEPLCLYCAVDDEEPRAWLPGHDVPEIFGEIGDGWRVVAHGYDFERNIIRHVLSRHGFPIIPDEIFHCSQRLALASAFPAELDLLAQALGLEYRKDPAARRAMLAVSRPRQQRKREASTKPTFDDDPEKLRLTYERCKLDVITCRAVWQHPRLKPLSETERNYQRDDMRINDRGVRLDRAFTVGAKAIAYRERCAINYRLAELTSGVITGAGQVKRFIEAINARGHDMATLNKQAVAQVLANQPDDFVRQLLECRRDGARAGSSKGDRLLAYAGPDNRLHGTLRMYGSGTGRWSALGPQLQNMRKNESGFPLSLVDSVRASDGAALARYGNPLAVLGEITRAALYAAERCELKSADFSAVESCVLAWLSGEQWKLQAFRTFQASGDVSREPYRVLARKMFHLPDDAEVTYTQRQAGKCGELACGFGGSLGAWRRIAPKDTRPDDEILNDVREWRKAHPATTKYWRDIARAVRVAIRTRQQTLVAAEPLPRVVVNFDGTDLTITLPSGRAITYPDARLVPSRYEEGDPDCEFYDNAKGQWKPYRAWFGTFCENIVQGVARDLLAAAINRCEMKGWPVVLHCHDEVTIEVLIGAVSDAEFLSVLLVLPDWAAGLPLGGKVHSGPHYLEAPDKPAEPLAVVNDSTAVIEAAIDAYVGDAREIITIDDDFREDARDYVDELPDTIAPLNELCSLPLSGDDKVCCPFHDDAEPSCKIYPNHFHCFGCGAHGNRIDWLVKAEGMTKREALVLVKDWTPCASRVLRNGSNPDEDERGRKAFIKKLWLEAVPIAGTIAARYLDETRHIDLTALPTVDHCLRFHPECLLRPWREGAVSARPDARPGHGSPGWNSAYRT